MPEADKQAPISSRYKGVSWIARTQKWKAQISVDGKRKILGYFDDESNAARAYDEIAVVKNRPLNFKVDACEDEAENTGQKEVKVDKQGKKTPAPASTEIVEDAPKVKAAATAKSRDAEKTEAKKTRFTGLSWLQSKKRWVARILIDGKRTHLGYFQDEEDAARKYDEVAATIPGKALNFPRAAPMQPCINGDLGDLEGEKVQASEVKSMHGDVVAAKQSEIPPNDNALEGSKQGGVEKTEDPSESTTKVPSETPDSSDDESEDVKPTQLEASSEDGESDESEEEAMEEEDDDDEFSGAARIETALLAATKSKDIQGVLNSLGKASSFEMSLVVLKTTGLARIVGRLRRHSDLNVSKAATDLVTKWKGLR